MKLVEQTDKDGYKHLYWVKDNDDPDTAKGISANPPNLDRLDWEQIKRNLHNQLVERRLLTWQDVMKQQNGVSGVILSVMKKELIALYRSVEHDE